MENTIEEKILQAKPYELDAEEILERIIRLGFGGDRDLYERFRQKFIDNLPAGTGVSLRGSALTNERYEDGTPFDSKGKGTSDLDITLIGQETLAMFKPEEFYIPGLHSKPLGDKDPDIATPELNALRLELQEMVGRPVNIHVTGDSVLFVRDVLLGQPHFMIIQPEETAKSDTQNS